ncbi:hypothetical protein BDW74DRAFT_179156 [Aspergillus multicolor]|uniref:uncharacterized protein n=1 Tax=Aspergillus multicolor TaxID=41759 RepID=UPI003CCD753B
MNRPRSPTPFPFPNRIPQPPPRLSRSRTPIPLASHLTILTAPTEPEDAKHWVLLYGPTYPSRKSTTELWTFVDIFSSDLDRKNGSGYSCAYRTEEMDSSFMVAPWEMKRTITVPEGKAVSHKVFKETAGMAVLSSERSWLSILLDSVVEWRWIGPAEKAELEADTGVQAQLDGEGVKFGAEVEMPVRTKKAIVKRKRSLESTCDAMVEAGISAKAVLALGEQAELPLKPKEKAAAKKRRKVEAEGSAKEVGLAPDEKKDLPLRPKASARKRPG